MLELYHHNISVCAQKVRLALVEKDLAWESRHLNLMTAEQVSPAYLALNPKGVVPTLVHDGAPVIESTIILEYLEDAFPDTPLRPDDPLARAAMRVWTKRIDEEVFPVTGPLTFAISHRHAVLANPPEMVEEYINKLGPDAAPMRRKRLERGVDHPDVLASLKVYQKLFADMDTVLAERNWLAGDGFSLAEIGMIPFVNRLDMLQLSEMWTGSHPHLTGWWERMKARPMFQDAMFKYIPEPLIQLMTDKGQEAWPKLKAILAT